MTLLARITKLFQADMHAVLDKIEEPEMLLKQAIREMAAVIATEEQSLRLLAVERQQLSQQQAQLAETLVEMEEKITLCFKSAKEDLARLVIKRKLEAQQLQSGCAEKLTALNEKFSRLTQQLNEHQAQLAGMQQKADTFLESDNSTLSHWQPQPQTVLDEDVEVAFLCEKQKWSAV
jgi:phage shock protein A